MQKIKFLLYWITIFVITILSLSNVQAQLGVAPPPGSPYVEPCGTDIIHQNLMDTDTEYALQHEKMLKDIKDYIDANPGGVKTGTVYQIPLVVHVMHTGGAIGTIYNPTDANIIAMVDGLNDWFRNQGAFFTAGGVDVEIEFILAQRDPNCNATTGINRVNAGASLPAFAADGMSMGAPAPGAPEIDVKDLSRWPNTDYYNIWVVSKINGADGTAGTFVAGFAYFPGAAANVDGTVMLATQIAPTSTTLPHEIGHALALFHTFQGSTGIGVCPANDDCTTDGDRVCDTDPHDANHFQCTTNACAGFGPLPVLNNIMSYSTCPDRFTDGQKTRMRAALTTQRPGLISSLGGTPPPAIPPAVACIPTATGTFFNEGVQRVQFNTINVASQGSNPEGTYVDRTCTQGTTVEAGNDYNLTIRTFGFAHKVRAYIDFNNDGDFDDPGEEILTGISVNIGGAFGITQTITIPTAGVLFDQPLRMRIAAVWMGSPDPTPCSVAAEGQAEDYTVVILNNNCAITALTAGTPTACEPATNEYTQEITVTYANPPATGDLVVNGQTFAITGSPQTVTLTGLNSDGALVDVTASFSAAAA
ncbi:MAG: hypothetical protein JJT94_10320, partial [Bernardetiaceae bacterium]|nr:hypothetical protein [Bernardetiaceae bacterium]